MSQAYTQQETKPTKNAEVQWWADVEGVKKEISLLSYKLV